MQNVYEQYIYLTFYASYWWKENYIILFFEIIKGNYIFNYFFDKSNFINITQVCVIKYLAYPSSQNYPGHCIN